MTRYLSLPEVLHLHRAVIELAGGSPGIRDFGLLQAAVASPRTTFGGEELYREVEEKAAALCFSLAMNHPFVDGNKRVAYAATSVFLAMNGFTISASVDAREGLMLHLAAGLVSREDLVRWLQENTVAG